VGKASGEGLELLDKVTLPHRSDKVDKSMFCFYYYSYSLKLSKKITNQNSSFHEKNFTRNPLEVSSIFLHFFQIFAEQFSVNWFF
jgi:hypothetical protein